jgi:short-subunit dehydrogenase
MVDLKGRTALVTGASAGIGRSVARILAREVGTLVLVARRRERLEELAAEIERSHPACRAIVRDVDLVDRAATSTMIDALEQGGVRVDVLVNNAGFGTYGLFEKSDWPRLERMIELNVVSATFLLHRLLPGMIERGFGAILNVGSSAGMFPGPGMAVYASTKAYVNHMSETLTGELAGTGVSVTSLCPGPVPTEFQVVAERDLLKTPKAMIVDVEACAEDAVSALKKGRARVIPGLAMSVAVSSLEALPKAMLRPLLRRAGRKKRAG